MVNKSGNSQNTNGQAESKSADNAEILLVEPSRLHKEVLLNYIKLAELTAEWAKDEFQAIELIKNNQFRLIVCASELMKSKGFELAKQVREISGENVPILMLTSSEDKTILNNAFSNGVTEVIQRSHLVALQGYFNQIRDAKGAFSTGIGKVLCVEDSRPISDLIKCVLEEEGHEVETLTNAEDALALFEEREDFDLLITDILLEGKMTGIGLTREIRQMESQIARIPILAISGLDNVDQRIESLKQGATDFVSKPINFDELAVRTRNLITSKKLYDKVLAQEQELRKMAVTDQLTGLYNRHYLSEAGLKRVEEAKRHDQVLSLLIIDIDHFKKVNDTYGHATGDTVLRLVGNLLKSSCRKEDFAVRFGGEEFVLVLPHCSLDDAVVKAEKLRKSVYALKPEGIPITASFGISSFDKSQNIDSFNHLFQLADQAVYEAKENGRDQVVTMKPDAK